MAEEPGKGAPSLEPPRLWRKKKPADSSPAEHTVPVVPVVPETGSADDIRTDWSASTASAPESPAETPAPARVETPWIAPAGRSATRTSEAPAAPRPARPARSPRAPRAARAPRPPRQRIEIPPLNPHIAAAVTGLIVGGWLVLSTFTTLRMCESVRGASACGGPGLLLLLVIVAGGIALGAILLRSFRVRSAASMSFLAVALVAVLVMVFFAGSLDQWWTIPVVAILTIGAYSLSHWMTTTYIDPQD